jgi:mutator protein MutT
MNQHATGIIRTYFGKHVPCFLVMRFLQKKERVWRFAGGRVEEGETPEQALVREFQEELGIKVTQFRKVHESVTRADGGVWTGHWFLLEDFLGRPKIQEPEKHDRLRYMTKMQLRYYGCGPEFEAVQQIAAPHRWPSYVCPPGSTPQAQMEGTWPIQTSQ